MTPARPSAAAALWQTLLRFDKSKVAPWVALRNTIGIVTPLAIAVAVGDPVAGTFAAIGAMNVSFSDGSDPYIRRGRRMLTATALGAIAVVIGGLFGSHPVGSIALATVWAFAAGMLVSLDNAAGDIGLISLVTLVIFSAQNMTPEQSVYAAMVALGGGLLQIALSLGLWPLRRHEPERRAVADLYFALSRLASTPIKAEEAPPATAELSHARSTMASVSGSRSIQIERYWSLLNQAERIRLSLLVLSRLAVRLQREQGTASHADVANRARELAAVILNDIGNALSGNRTSPLDPTRMGEFSRLADTRAADEGGADERAGIEAAAMALVRDAHFQIDALAGQLRSAVELAVYSTHAGRKMFEQREGSNPWTLRIAGSLVILRANLSLHSAAFRHAVRLAMCIGIGASLARILGWERSYWLPMTVAIVLKPDFTGTFSRGVLRLAGTAVGLALATALFHFLPLTHATEVALLGLFAFLLRCFGPGNYGIFVVAISALVVLLFALTGVLPAEVVVSRALNTAAGGLLALGVYAVWPTWERTQVSESLARLLDAYRDYFRAVREGYVQSESAGGQEIDGKRLLARLARSNFEASVERFRAEPGVDADAVAQLDSALASSHRFVHAVMALDAGLTRSHYVPPRPQFVTFANNVELTLHSLAAALRGSHLDAGDLPDLRANHHALIHAGDPLAERYALVNIEADRLTNSLNTLREQLLQAPTLVASAQRATT